MLITLKGRNMCVNCDWLSFSIKIDPRKEVIAPVGMRYEKLAGTNIYKQRWILYDNQGAKVMTFCCDPYSSVISDELATCQVANPFLYNPSIKWLEQMFNSFKGGTYHGLSRWDVCCDFVPTDAEYGTIRKLTSGAQYVSGKSAGSLFWHSEKYGEREYRMAHCLSWGTPTTALKVKLYNKSLEIDAANPERCEKPYILQEWEGHLPDTTKVWRLEFSLTDANQFAIGNRRLGFDDALSSDILCRFFSEVKKKRFVVRKNQGKRHGHKNEDEIVPFLPFDLDGLEIRKAQSITERTPLDEERQLARHLLIHMSDKSVLCDNERYSSIRRMLFDLAENPLISGYLDSMTDGSFCGFISRLDECRGAGVYDVSDIFGK